MQFKPKSESELKEAERIRLENLLWSEGEYDFAVIFAIDKFTKDKFDSVGNLVKAGGTPMIELKLNIFNESGESKFVFDWLTESMEFKLRHAAYACGLGSNYESGCLNADDFSEKMGRLILDKKPARGQYGAGNGVRDYIVTETAATSITVAKSLKARETKDELNDNIPF